MKPQKITLIINGERKKLLLLSKEKSLFNEEQCILSTTDKKETFVLSLEYVEKNIAA